ncbi:hypothetical protein AKJ18_20175 [Vibrio xuii]|nr:hypothetical protein AKJ18_20175 [Vibrio xuii]
MVLLSPLNGLFLIRLKSLNNEGCVLKDLTSVIQLCSLLGKYEHQLQFNILFLLTMLSFCLQSNGQKITILIFSLSQAITVSNMSHIDT